MCFFHKLSYGYEIAESLNNFIFTDSVQRFIHHAVTAVSGNFQCLLRGSSSSGKKSTIRSLANILARTIFECDFTD